MPSVTNRTYAPCDGQPLLALCRRSGRAIKIMRSRSASHGAHITVAEAKLLMESSEPQVAPGRR
jgi:hypothetical protein